MSTKESRILEGSVKKKPGKHSSYESKGLLRVQSAIREKERPIRRDLAFFAYQRRLNKRDKNLNKIKFKLLNLALCLFAVISFGVSNTPIIHPGVLLEVKQ